MVPMYSLLKAQIRYTGINLAIKELWPCHLSSCLCGRDTCGRATLCRIVVVLRGRATYTSAVAVPLLYWTPVAVPLILLLWPCHYYSVAVAVPLSWLYFCRGRATFVPGFGGRATFTTSVAVPLLCCCCGRATFQAMLWPCHLFLAMLCPCHLCVLVTYRVYGRAIYFKQKRCSFPIF
jgi:hypothetical protein